MIATPFAGARSRPHDRTSPDLARCRWVLLVDVGRMTPICARKRCRRKATEAYDVFSWFEEQRKQTPRHYEVCAKHAKDFTGTFDKEASRNVKERYVEWSEARGVAA